MQLGTEAFLISSYLTQLKDRVVQYNFGLLDADP